MGNNVSSFLGCLKNKLVYRKLLKDRINLDSDKLGKMGWTFDSRSIVLQNFSYFSDEIYACALWHKSGSVKLVNNLIHHLNGRGKSASTSSNLLYRIYLISSWFNRNEYL